MLIGAATLGIFAAIAIYMFGHAKPVVIQAQITDVLMARGLDAHGNPIGISQKFSTKHDTSVYAVVDLKNATKKTQVAYVRYYNGRYVDSKITVPSKDAAPKVFFYFEKGAGSYPAGNYTIVTYVNGKRAVQADYAYEPDVQGTASYRAHAAIAAVADAFGSMALAAERPHAITFVMRGIVTASTSKVLSVRVTNTSKNMLALKNTYQTIPLAKHTRITQHAKLLPVKMLMSGTTVLVYGIYDQASSRYIKVQWVKAL